MMSSNGSCLSSSGDRNPYFPFPLTIGSRSLSEISLKRKPYPWALQYLSVSSLKMPASDSYAPPSSMPLTSRFPRWMVSSACLLK